MSQYTNLLATINAQIKANGVGAITGPLLNAVLRQMVSVLGDGYRLVGVAAPGDNPGTPDNQVAYLAGQDGTYTNFGGITLSGEVALLVWGASWSKQSLFSIDSAVTPGSGNPVSSDAVDAALAALAGKYQKLVPTAVEGHLAEFDGAGQVRDAGVSLDELPANFAACLYDRRSAGTPQSPYTFRQSGGDGVDYLKSIKGRTLVWNQLVQNGDFADGTTGWGNSGFYPSVYSASGGVLALTPADTSTTKSNVSVAQTLANSIIAGHTYLIKIEAKVSESTKTLSGRFAGVQNDTIFFSQNTISTSWATFAATIAASYANTRLMLFCTGGEDNATVDIKNVILIDLTLLGWVPSSVSEFRAVYPLSYYAYNAGALINNAATDLESTGFNQWGEEWEVGTISTTTGEKMPNPNGIRSKNDIAVFPNTAYFYRQPANEGNPRIAFLDVNHETISVIFSGTVNVIFTTPENCRYIRFSSHASQYGTTYNHDICINISDPSRNGTYEPYWKATRHLGLDSFKVTDGENVITVNGLKSAGSVYDEIIEGKKFVKRIETRAYQSGDENDSAVTTDGTNTNYPLATPKEYELVEPIQPMLEVDELGTERRLPEDTAAAVNAPFESDSNYSVSVANLVRKLSE